MSATGDICTNNLFKVIGNLLPKNNNTVYPFVKYATKNKWKSI